MNHLPLPLRTSRLVLRQHHASDAGPLHSLYSQPAVAVYLLEEPWTEQYAQEQIEKRLGHTGLDTESRTLALVIEHQGRVIGDVALWLTEQEHRVAEIGWVLNPAYGGQGFAAEAAVSVLRIGFDTYGLHRISAQMDARNTASAKLAERLGMSREAHLRQNWFSKGEWTDTLIYAALGADPPQSRNRVGSPLALTQSDPEADVPACSACGRVAY